jgi:endonuclease/exonuclease/phosphatase family metal-dependent hydrolase
MTFNLRYNQPTDGLNAWPHRREMVADAVRLHRPDLLGLQEDHREHVAYLRDHLPEYDWVGDDAGSEDGDEQGEFGSIGYRGDLTCEQSGTFWLSETPATAGSVGWDGNGPRTVTWGQFRTGSGATLYQFNTHFDVKPFAQRNAALLLRERVGEVAGGRPSVVTGDLNVGPGTLPHRLLTARDRDCLPVREKDTVPLDGPQLRDAMAVAPVTFGPEATFNNFGTPWYGDTNIDHVLVTDGVAVDHYGVFADEWDGRYPSDHYPVAADVAVG